MVLSEMSYDKKPENPCIGCGNDEGATQVCIACHNELGVKLDKARAVLSTINYLAASKFPGKTNEDALYEIQLLSFGMIEFLEKKMEIE
jgi:hypothetical protein